MMSTMRDIGAAATLSVEQSHKFARSHPMLFYVGQVCRTAAAMSLVLILTEGLGWTVFDIDATQRLKFVLLWAAGVSVLLLLDARSGGHHAFLKRFARHLRR